MPGEARVDAPPDEPAEDDWRHANWQGHTHKWPKNAKRGRLVRCAECGMPETWDPDDHGLD